MGGDTRAGPFGRSMREWLERRIATEWRERFHFEPPRPRAALASAIADATVRCFPSRWENFPNVCLEAMSAGSLVVGSNAGGMAEVIEDGQLVSYFIDDPAHVVGGWVPWGNAAPALGRSRRLRHVDDGQ